MKKALIFGCGLVIVALTAWLVLCDREELPTGDRLSAGEKLPTESVRTPKRVEPAKRISPRQDTPAASEAAEEPQSEDEQKTPEEMKEEADEAKVEAFDNLTDKWMEPGTVTMKDVETFVKSFKNVPKERQDECVHRALNLIPDENILLLAGILTDKSFDRDVLETVYNDILNRDEEVKKPILELVYKDKTHPCWADTAWIFDVTGQKPAKEK